MLKRFFFFFSVPQLSPNREGQLHPWFALCTLALYFGSRLVMLMIQHKLWSRDRWSCLTLTHTCASASLPLLFIVTKLCLNTSVLLKSSTDLLIMQIGLEPSGFLTTLTVFIIVCLTTVDTWLVLQKLFWSVSLSSFQSKADAMSLTNSCVNPRLEFVTNGRCSYT